MTTTPPVASGTLPWRSVLLTTDFSADSLKAWEQVKSLAKLGSVMITVLHVSEPSFSGLRIHTESLHEEFQRAEAEKLARLANENLPNVPHVTTRIEQGRAATVICDVARNIGADLIVISSHGHSGLGHVLLGSVAEHVVRQSSCAVLVVPVDRRDER